VANYGVVTGYVTSLKAVGGDIVSGLTKAGFDAKLFTKPVQWYDAVKLFERGILFVPFLPLSLSAWVLIQRDYNLKGIPAVTYVTVEGEPKRVLVPDWIRRDGRFVANSHFTKSMLERVDVHVEKVVHHGVDLDLVRSVGPYKQALKQELRAEVVFGTVASCLPRKGLTHLAAVAAHTVNYLPGAKYVVMTEPEAADYFRGLKNVSVLTSYGKLTRNEVYALIASLDFYLCSSLSEGFCLPVLEAQALGVPVVYPAYEPLTEVAHPTANFPVPVTGVTIEDHRQGVWYYMHNYNTEDMAEAVKEAYHTYVDDRDEYDRRCEQVNKHAEQFSHVDKYTKLV